MCQLPPRSAEKMAVVGSRSASIVLLAKIVGKGVKTGVTKGKGSGGGGGCGGGAGAGG